MKVKDTKMAEIQKRKIPIIVTDNAVDQIKALLKQRNKESFGIRIGVKTGGCSGFTYSVEYADSSGPFDEIIEVRDVNILIDPKAIMYLIGTEMDYVEGDFKSGFVFNNPNEKSKCGCGKSFGV
jgi:iron-sulfur cluster assembly protein